MKILHTSDWHLGRRLYGRKRYEEFAAFLDWLAALIEREGFDVLLVAGDVFDTTTPSNRAQALYYQFLCRVAASACRHVVVIAGNHDSPAFLEAPQALLKALHVHVVGSPSPSLADEVLVLRDNQGEPELIVCAVPYLRDKDIRIAEAGECIEDKERKLLEGIRAHYAAIAELAQAQCAALAQAVPIVAMGHLFTAGGKTVDGDGVRELYVGSLAHVSAEIFPACFDYVALGHLHVPQAVNQINMIRYSGSPLPMGFGEAKQQKQVCDVELSGDRVEISTIDVPVFQRLARVQGDWQTIAAHLHQLAAQKTQYWLEVIYDGDDIIGDLRDRVAEAVQDSELEVLRIKHNRIANRALHASHTEETLDDMTVDDVFKRCLSAHEVPEEQQPELLYSYHEVIQSLSEDNKD